MELIEKKVVLDDKMASDLWNNLMLCCQHNRTFCTSCCNDQKCLICNKIVGETCNCTYEQFLSTLTLEKYEKYVFVLEIKK